MCAYVGESPLESKGDRGNATSVGCIQSEIDRDIYGWMDRFNFIIFGGQLCPMRPKITFHVIHVKLSRGSLCSRTLPMTVVNQECRPRLGEKFVQASGVWFKDVWKAYMCRIKGRQTTIVSKVQYSDSQTRFK